MSTTQERLHRSLSILRRLQRGSASRDALMTHVDIDLPENAYDIGADASSRSAIFEKDIVFLREVLQVDLPSFDRRRNVYDLEGFGSFRPLFLTDEEIETVLFLIETFRPDAPKSESVQNLLRRLQSLLPDDQQNLLAARTHKLQLDLRRRDGDEIDPRVEEKVQRAVERKQMLRFDYLAASQSDGIARTHTVEPWYLVFDATRGHFYLDAYRRSVEGPHGIWNQPAWSKYRLGRIQFEELQILPDKLPPTPPKRPRHHLHYELAPEIARLGVTRHFEDMQVSEPNADGWVTVQATTSDLFRACRLLLGYGPNCRVLGDTEARREMEELVRGLVGIYGTDEKPG